MDVNLLIECVKKHVYLYDLSCREYTNISLKTSAWESIAEEMDETSEAVRHKWKTVKDGYMKYKKQLLRGFASGSFNKVTEYRWSRQLKFLDSHQVTRTIDTIPRTSVNKPQPSSLKELLMPSIQTTHSSRQDLLLLEPLQQRANSKAPAIRLHNELNPQCLSPIEKNSEEESEEQVNKMKTPTHDSIDYLFLSYAQTFKKFPLRQQAVMKIELANMFSKAELKISDFESDNPFSFVQVQSVMSIEGIDNEDSPTQWSSSSSCSDSKETISQDDGFEEHIVP